MYLPTALDMAKDYNYGRDRELNKRLNADNYIRYVVRECYETCERIMNDLVLGHHEKM